MAHGPEKIKELYVRAKDVLGPEGVRSLRSAKQRFDAFNTALGLAIKAMDGPEHVTDDQIWGALDTALIIWPDEMEILRPILERQKNQA